MAKREAKFLRSTAFGVEFFFVVKREKKGKRKKAKLSYHYLNTQISEIADKLD